MIQIRLSRWLWGLTCFVMAMSPASWGRAESSPVTDFEQNAMGLIHRVIPKDAAKIRVERIPAVGEDHAGVYELETVGENLVLRGDCPVSVASGLYHYLKEYVHGHVSWNGDQLDLSEDMPKVPSRVRVVSPVAKKMAYNYCTHGYTMAWWDWSQWQRELDLLAMRGVNMALIIQGQEAVWQETFEKFGYSKEEMRLWLSSPVHLPWQFMQNLEGLLPAPQSSIDRRLILGKQIVQRCRELGIEPILQGYYGMIPWKFKEKFGDAQVVEQGKWGAQLRRPDMLHIEDPRFAAIAAEFLRVQKKHFGECKYYAADPFHEGGKTGGMDRGKVFQKIQDLHLQFDPHATIVKQCWQASNKEMFDVAKKDHVLALDLWCEVSPYWKKAKGYDGTPWLWCLLHNFGGNLGMEANLPRLVQDFGNVLGDPGHGKLAGFGMVPEGSWQNPVVYELMTEMGWRGAPKDVAQWLVGYQLARYGKPQPEVAQAWQAMLRSNYSYTSQQAPMNSVITGAPSLDPNCRGRRWSTLANVKYAEGELVNAWSLMLAGAEEFASKDTYQYDLADIGRQVLCNFSRDVHGKMVAAYRAKDLGAFDRESHRLLELIDDLDALTATRREWLLGAWVEDAKRWGDTPQEKAYYDRCARMILTNWALDPWDGPDYANREWNGLLKQYYGKRWQMLVERMRLELTGGPVLDLKAYGRERTEFEMQWIAGGSELLKHPQGDAVKLSQVLQQKYAAMILSYHPEWQK